MTSGGAGAARSAHAARSAARTRSAVSGLPSRRSSPSCRARRPGGAPWRRPSRPRPRAARADALELGGRLDAPARGDRRVVDRQLDPVGAQALRDPERELGIDRRRAHAGLPRHPGDQLEQHLVARQPALQERVEAERLEVDQLGVGPRRGEPLGLQRRGHDHRAAVHLRVEERVDDADRNLVPQGRGADGVAVEQDVGHPAQVTRARSASVGAVPAFRIMGVVNVTPDSFSDGGEFLDPGAAVAHGLRLAAEGADLLDVGGESTRPGAEPVEPAEELRARVPVIAGIRARDANVRISIDTSKAVVAAAALDAGADYVNDVTALRGDPDMAALVAERRRRRLPHAHARHAAHDAGRTRATTTSSPTSALPRASAWTPPSRRGHRARAHRGRSRHRLRQDGRAQPRAARAARRARRARAADRAGHVAQGVPRPDHRPRGRRAGAPATLATLVLGLERGATMFRVHDVAPARDALAVAAATLARGWPGTKPRTTTTTT